MVARSTLPPGDGRLRARGHPPTSRLEHSQLPAGAQVFPRGDGLPAPRHRLHC